MRYKLLTLITISIKIHLSPFPNHATTPQDIPNHRHRKIQQTTVPFLQHSSDVHQAVAIRKVVFPPDYVHNIFES